MKYLILFSILAIGILTSCKKDEASYLKNQGTKMKTQKAKKSARASTSEWKNIHAVTDADEKVLDNRPFAFNSAFVTIESRIADRVVASRSVWAAENGLFVKLNKNSNAKLSTQLRHGAEIFEVDQVNKSISMIDQSQEDWKNLCGVSKLLEKYKFKMDGISNHLDIECDRYTNSNPKNGPDEILMYKGMAMLIIDELNGEVHRWIVTRFDEEAMVQERMFVLPDFDLK